jgi:PAS domain S-box-containing protein
MNKKTQNSGSIPPENEVPLQETDLLRTIIEVTTDHIYVKDAEGRFLMVNSPASAFLGRTAQEIIGKRDSDFLPPQLAKEIREHDLAILENGETRTYEEQISISGIRRTFLSVKAPFRDGNKRIIGLIGISRDITDRKETEMRLRTEHAFRQPIEESMLAGVVAVNFEGMIIYANPSFCKMVGWKPEELIGKTAPYPFWPSDETKTLMAILKKRLAGSGPREVEFRFTRRTGEIIDVVSLGSPLTDGEGKRIGILSTFHDITERKQSENELRLQSEIIKNMAGGVLLVRSADGIIVHTSARLDQLFGYESGELLGKHFSILTGPSNLTPEEMSKSLTEELRKNHFWSGERQNVKKDGTLFWTFVNITSFDHPRFGNVWVNVKDDITDRRTVVEERERIQKLESLGLLAGGIAHDFNNILTGILGNISLAKTGLTPNSPSFQRLEEAERASDQAKELARQLLTFAKGGTPVKKRVSLLTFLENSVTFALRGTNILPKFSIQNNLWPVEIDEGQINQVIQNITINAQQAMVRGGILQVEARNRTIREKSSNQPDGLSSKKGQYVEISIRDTGVGIPNELLSKIFDPYFTTKVKGTGLGLAISHSVIQKHEGFIHVKSESGKGTTFFIFLPASPHGTLIESPLIKESGELLKGNGRILIMDDEESVLNVACEMLRHLGYDVDSSQKGSQALALYQNARRSEKRFDLVITDLNVPGDFGGIELLKRLKKLDADVKVIVSSGYSNDPAIANFRSLGFSDCIVKPYRISDMSFAVARTMEC